MTQQVFSVSELNEAIRLQLETGFSGITVEGEISNLAKPASGRLYFSLKDANASVSCALFKGNQYNVKVPWNDIQNGLMVRATGKASLYTPRGQYQLILSGLEDAGIGNLEQEYQARLQRLQAEGIFNPANKRPIPLRPTRIGVITSASGAAVRDVLTTIARRNPAVSIIIYPCLVQGKDAPAQILSALTAANRRDEVDVLLMVRGGGSLEDLWAFNDEALARAVAASRLPIISGVGHEIDTTLVDFAADHRAPTPTAAAELATPVLVQITQQLDNRMANAQNQLNRIFKRHHERLAQLEHRLTQQSPRRRLQHDQQRTDELQLRLHRAIENRLNRAKQTLNHLEQRHRTQLPTRRLTQAQQHLTQASERLHRVIHQTAAAHRHQFHTTIQRFELLNPLGILQRGYAIAQTEDGYIIKSVTQITPEQSLTVRVSDGIIHCKHIKKEAL